MSTLTYYSTHAADFACSTASVDFVTTEERFLQYVAASGRVLDFGCGSGRDARYFAERGYRVTAVDGCPELVELAREFTGLPVEELLFQDLAAVAEFDGVWACASILHLSKDELVDVLKKIYRALKPGGCLYMSFKYGDFAGERNGRYFTDLTKASLAELLKAVPGFAVVDEWVSNDVRPDRGEEKWLNVILRRG